MADIEIKTYSMTDAIEEKEKKKEKKVKSTSGLRKGAYGVIFAYIAFLAYLNPFSLDFIPYGITINKTFLIPESVFILILFAILSLLFSMAGTIISIFRKSMLGFLLSFLIFGNVSYISAKVYSVYEKNPKVFDQLIDSISVSDILSKISIIKKSDLNSEKNIIK